MPHLCRPILLVEGDGDLVSVPVLFRRVIARLGAYGIDPAPRPIKTGQIARLRRPGELERFVSYGTSREEGDGVLLLLDCDDDCPVDVARAFCNRIAAVRPILDKPIGIGFFKKEFECLFLAGVDSLANEYPECGWDLSNCPIADTEEIRGAKGLLNRLMRDRSYKETRDQPRFAARVDLDELFQKSRSYRHCEALVRWMSEKKELAPMIYPMFG